MRHYPTNTAACLTFIFQQDFCCIIQIDSVKMFFYIPGVIFKIWYLEERIFPYFLTEVATHQCSASAPTVFSGVRSSSFHLTFPLIYQQMNCRVSSSH